VNDNSLPICRVIHRRGPWRSFEAVEFATLEWVDWFNTPAAGAHREHPAGGSRGRYYAMLEQPAVAA
jgi:putative transposase